MFKVRTSSNGNANFVTSLVLWSLLNLVAVPSSSAVVLAQSLNSLIAYFRTNKPITAISFLTDFIGLLPIGFILLHSSFSFSQLFKQNSPHLQIIPDCNLCWLLWLFSFIHCFSFYVLVCQYFFFVHQDILFTCRLWARIPYSVVLYDCIKLIII